MLRCIMNLVLCFVTIRFCDHVFTCACFAGHMSDPVDIPGLAHFCEHMVFLGSEKVCLLILIHSALAVSQFLFYN